MIISTTGVAPGLAEIEAIFDELFGGLRPTRIGDQRIQQEIDGEMASFVLERETPSNGYEFVTDTSIRDGTTAVQTVAGVIESKD